MIAKKVKEAKPPTSAQLEAQITKLDEQLTASRDRVTALVAEKEQLLRAAYTGDAAAKTRVDEINTALGVEARAEEDIAKVQEELRDELKGTRQREDAAAAERLEDELEKLEATLTDKADAIMDAARAVRPKVDDFRETVTRVASLWIRSQHLRGEREPGAYVASVELDIVAQRALEVAGLPMPPQFGLDRADLAAAYRAGRAADRTEESAHDDVNPVLQQMRAARRAESEALERRVAPHRNGR